MFKEPLKPADFDGLIKEVTLSSEMIPTGQVNTRLHLYCEINLGYDSPDFCFKIKFGNKPPEAYISRDLAIDRYNELREFCK